MDGFSLVYLARTVPIREKPGKKKRDNHCTFPFFSYLRGTGKWFVTEKALCQQRASHVTQGMH